MSAPGLGSPGINDMLRHVMAVIIVAVIIFSVVILYFLGLKISLMLVAFGAVCALAVVEIARRLPI